MQDRKLQAPMAGGSAPSGGSGLPWGKLLLGCGCLTVMMALAGVGLAWWLFSSAKESLEESGQGGLLAEIQELAAGASGGEGGVAADRDESSRAEELDGRKVDPREAATKARKDALSQENLLAYIREPLTMGDVKAYEAFMKTWRADPDYQRWEEQWKAMRNREKSKEDKDSMVGQLKAVRETTKTMSAMRAVWKAYDEHVREHGGYEAHLGRLTRIGGVAAAADRVARQEKTKDANADAVAEAMLRERPGVVAEYEKNIAEARAQAAEAEQGDPAQQGAFLGLVSLAQDPGTLALARMPEESFETWEKLGESRRAKLRDYMKGGLASGSYFTALAGNPAVLLVGAYMAEIQDIVKR